MIVMTLMTVPMRNRNSTGFAKNHIKILLGNFSAKFGREDILKLMNIEIFIVSE